MAKVTKKLASEIVSARGGKHFVKRSPSSGRFVEVSGSDKYPEKGKSSKTSREAASSYADKHRAAMIRLADR